MATTIPVTGASLVPNTNYVYKSDFLGSIDFTDMEVSLNYAGLNQSWQNVTAAYGNNAYSYNWPNGAAIETNIPVGDPTTMVMPDGTYDDIALNQILYNTMINNTHYLVDSDENKYIFLKWELNKVQYRFELIVNAIPTASQAAANHPPLMLPSGATWALPTTQVFPQVNIPYGGFDNNTVGSLFGFAAQSYPSSNVASTYPLFLGILGQYAPTLSPVQAVFVLCNLVYNPSTPVNQCLYAFSGTGYGVGEPVVINPATALWIKSVDGSFASIIITLTDQRSLPLNQVDTAATFLISYRKRK